MNGSQVEINKLLTIQEISKLLNSSKDINYILDLLLEKSLQLIDGGDVGVIFLYNKDTKLLEATSFLGFNNNILKVKLNTNEAISGAAFSKQKTMFINDCQKFNEFLNTIRDENMEPLKKSLINRDVNDFHSSICCPLIFKEECIGVMVVDGFESQTPITHNDIFILEAISVQATIAIINAQQYENELKSKEVLEKYNQVISEERNKYKYYINLHRKFKEMVLKESSIRDILREISLLLQSDVFIIDYFFNIKDYYFNYYTNHQSISEISNDFRKYLKNRKSKYFDPDKDLLFSFFPIMVDMDILGWLCVVSDKTFYSELDNITIEKSSTVLSLELLKINELNNMEQSLKRDFLDNLLLNHNKEYLMRCANNYKFHFDKNHQFIIFEIKEDDHLTGQEKCKKKFKEYIKYYYNVINEEINKVFLNPIVLIKEHNIIVILEIYAGDNKKKIEHFLDNVLNITQTSSFSSYKKMKLKAGISQIIYSNKNFKTAYHNTLQILKILYDIQSEKHYLFYDDLEIEKLLLNNSHKVLENFLSRTLGPLLKYEKDAKNQFLKTLKVYIQSNGNWTYTKNHLLIHGNTLTYRLNRITDLLNIDLKDYYQRFNIQIAFEILDIVSDNFKDYC